MVVLARGVAPFGWLPVVATVGVVAYVEGYRAFRCSFCPRVVDRAFDAGAGSRLLPALLAPFYAMSLFGDEPERMRRAWAVVGMVVTAIIAIHHLPPVARAAIDGAVALSLLWGSGEILARFALRLRRTSPARTGCPANPASERPTQRPPRFEESRGETT